MNSRNAAAEAMRKAALDMVQTCIKLIGETFLDVFEASKKVGLQAFGTIDPRNCMHVQDKIARIVSTIEQECFEPFGARKQTNKANAKENAPRGGQGEERRGVARSGGGDGAMTGVAAEVRRASRSSGPRPQRIAREPRHVDMSSVWNRDRALDRLAAKPLTATGSGEIAKICSQFSRKGRCRFVEKHGYCQMVHVAASREPNTSCLYCGCESERDASGERICFCDSCKVDGCVPICAMDRSDDRERTKKDQDVKVWTLTDAGWQPGSTMILPRPFLLRLHPPRL